MKKTLISFERLSPGLEALPVFWPLFRLILRASLKRRLRCVDGTPVLLVPDRWARFLAEESRFRVYRWGEVSFLASCQGESLEEFTSFNREAIQILDGVQSDEFRGKVSVARALSYGFVSSHSEGLPFWISGLIELIQKEKIDSVDIPFFHDDHVELLKDVAQAQGLSVICRNDFSEAILAVAEKLYRRLALYFKLSKRRLINDRVCGVNQQADVLIAIGKQRTLRYTRLIQSAVEKLGIHRVNIFGPTQISSVRASLFGIFNASRAWNVLRKQWDLAQPRLQSLPHQYKGVPIAKYHIQQMRNVWFERGGATIEMIRNAEKVLEEASPRAVLVLEPLETSTILAMTARKHGIPVIAYYSIYDSAASTASIWESALQGMADHYAVINQWMKDRLVRAGIAPSQNSSVVGDVLVDITLSEMPQGQRKTVRDRLGLSQDSKFILVLSRPISSVLKEEEKEWIFRGVSETGERLNAAIVVKGHPNENLAVLKSEVQKWSGPRTIVLINELPLGELMAAADVVVGTPGSASSMDAIYAGVPLVLAGSSEVFDKLDRQLEKNALRKHGAALCLTLGMEFGDSISALLNDSAAREKCLAKAKEFAEMVSGVPDGKAAERLAEITEKFIS